MRFLKTILGIFMLLSMAESVHAQALPGQPKNSCFVGLRAWAYAHEYHDWRDLMFASESLSFLGLPRASCDAFRVNGTIAGKCAELKAMGYKSVNRVMVNTSYRVLQANGTYKSLGPAYEKSLTALCK